MSAPRTSIETMREVNPPQRAAIVRCSGEPLGCRMRFTGRVLDNETDAAARRRVLQEALAGRWVRRKSVVWCPSCATRLLVTR